MGIIDTNQLESNSVLRADLCVVGAGAAGITLAKAFDRTTLSVCLLESGGSTVDDEVQSLCDFSIAGYPMRRDFMSRARYLGGTTNLWAGRSMKLTEIDLQPRGWIPESGWPIAYGDLEYYYRDAARILGIPSHDAIETAMPERMSTAEKALFDSGEFAPNISLWAKRPLRFGPAYKRTLNRSSNVTTYVGATATEIRLNPAGDAVEAIALATLDGRRATVIAKRFILACGGLENARLLLVSRSVQTCGVGNQHDLVGRYYSDHPRAVFGKVELSEPLRLPMLLGAALSDGIAQAGIRLSAAVQRSERLLNHYLTLERQWAPHTAKSYESFVRSMKILLRRGFSGRRSPFSGAKLAKVPDSIYLFTPRELMPHSLYRRLKAVRSHFESPPTRLNVVNYCEQPPNPESRVYLSDHRDRLNMNRLVVDWKVGTAETQTLLHLHRMLDEHLRKVRIGRLVTDATGISYSEAHHHMGTTRMSEQPKTGVVDANCKVHGVDNLYIAGSSVFPTSGYANPTWTIIALALRLSDHLKETSEGLP